MTPPPGAPADARRCVVEAVFDHGGPRLLPTPTIIESTGSLELDERCKAIASAGGPNRQVPAGFEAPLQARTVLFLSPSDATFGQSEQGDGLSRAQIQERVSLAMPLIKRCYELELGARPDLAGKVVVAWLIDGAGRPLAVHRTEDELPPVGDCVIGIVETVTFPRPKGGGFVSVTYPFVFSSSERR